MKSNFITPGIFEIWTSMRFLILWHRSQFDTDLGLPVLLLSTIKASSWWALTSLFVEHKPNLRPAQKIICSPKKAVSVDIGDCRMARRWETKEYHQINPKENKTKLIHENNVGEMFWLNVIKFSNLILNERMSCRMKWTWIWPQLLHIFKEQSSVHLFLNSESCYHGRTT